MNPHPEPDVAFGLIPELGVAAAVADDRPALDEALRKHHFRYSPPDDVYLLPGDTPHTTAVRTVASATQEFQDNGFSVAADPKILLSLSPTATEALRSRVPEPSVHVLTSQLHDARQAMDVADVLGEVLDGRRGTFVRLDELFQAASVWCERLGNSSGHELSVHLRSMRNNVAFIGQQLADIQADLAAMPDGFPEGVPTLKEDPVWERREGPAPSPSTRAQAAIVPSPHRAQDVPATDTSATPSAIHPTTPRRTR
ncbi:hypothetical protein [Streptomyces sp. NBC_00483]|uniref:hypothetical protein n=1 Tax=Streptomyces sp. NBC_00483 TaxID=2975756 RepID=UPI002E189E0A